MVTIQYYGSLSALNGWTVSIPVDPYINHHNVLESAISYIEGKIPSSIVISEADDVFYVMNKGNLSVLIHWKVVF